MSKATREVNIPFSGFYDSLYSGIIDSWDEQTAEHYTEEQDENLPDELRLSAEDFGNIIMGAMDYSRAQNNIAATYADMFNRLVSKALGFELGLAFAPPVTSPRFYNFETDRIFCTIPDKTVAALFRLVKAEGFTTLKTALKERHTSYDGFCSYYSNDLDSWLTKGVKNWDHNELGTLLVAAMATSADLCDKDFRLSLYHAVSDDGCYAEMESAMDWTKFHAAVADLRAERAEEFHADNPDFVPPPQRCQQTPDLFKS